MLLIRAQQAVATGDYRGALDLFARSSAIMLVEQNVFQSLEIATRAYVLENGLIAMSGDADHLMEDEGLKSSYLGI